MNPDSLPVLLVDDEANMLRVMELMLRREGFSTISAEDGRAALNTLQTSPVRIVLTDLKMPGIDGMTLLRECITRYPDIPVIVLTAHGTIETAVEAMKIGAFDYITKPFDLNEIRNTLRKAAAFFARNSTGYHPPLETESLETNGDLPLTDGGIVAASMQMQKTLQMVERIAGSPSTVLLTGESGTGKELIAGLIHKKSGRKRFPFIRVNCAAIPETLMESEFFGHERGAFTGAVTSKPGRFELADRGTLLLDEISEISTEVQVKLLRVIQEREFERVGGIRTIQVDVRLIAATNCNLEELVARGDFRQDLFYRLNVLPIRLPPLRERPDDIEHLVNYFIQRMNRRLNRTVKPISSGNLAFFHNHTWPGNIRELENVIERAVLLCDSSELDMNCLNIDLVNTDSGNNRHILTGRNWNLKKIVRDKTDSLEKTILLQALVRTHGNVSRAAKLVGLSRKGFQLKLQRHSIDPKLNR
jgi:two-component system, NtrC family, response regulator AtoC